jgi:hypothetical protein
MIKYILLLKLYASYRYQKKKILARGFDTLRLGVAVLVPFSRRLPYSSAVLNRPNKAKHH